jgi:hypothetical protein
MAQSPLFFTQTPEIYPQAWDPIADSLFCVRLSEDEFRRASFLDQRVLTPTTPGRWYAWREALSAAAALPPPSEPQFIFHIGHVGSTLLSRLLGAHRGVFALREPATLRTLAELREGVEAPESRISPEAYDTRLAVLLKLWGRGWSTDQRAIVKATSLACALAGPLLARLVSPRALFMLVQPEAYLASILGAPHSPADIAAMAPARLRRLHRAVGEPAWRLWRLSPGEMVAMSWASEMLALRTAAREAPDAVEWIEFDRFLYAPAEGLRRSLAHLGVAIDAKSVDAIVASPLMRQYSKAPEHAYDAHLRREVLLAAQAEHGGDIAKGLAWLEAASSSYPAIADALAFSRTLQ